jgi:hypothetical protein
MGEDRARDELQLSPPGLRVLLDDVSAGDIRRHQVRRKLDAAKGEIERSPERLHHHRLGQPRHTLEQAMTPAQNRVDKLFQDLILADDDLVHLPEHLLTSFLEAGNPFGLLERHIGRRSCFFHRTLVPNTDD